MEQNGNGTAAGFEFTLPVGYEDADGRVQRTAVLRKMTGRDEAAMADRRNRTNGARIITELIGNCLLQLGDIEHPGVQVARAMYSADRQYLLVKLREITFGSEMQATYPCPTCREATVRIENLDELEVGVLEDGELLGDVVVDLEDGYTDRDGTRYDTITFRAPRGDDEERITATMRENPSHGKNALMARCVVSLGDMPEARIQALGTALFSDLTLSDRAKIDRAVNNGGPGIKLRREVTCGGCGRDFTAALDMSNFLAPS
jgi:hypothetical protein